MNKNFIYIGAALSVLAILVVGFMLLQGEQNTEDTSTDSESREQASNNDSSTETNLESEEKADQRSQVGEPVELAGEQITVLDFGEGTLESTVLGEIEQGKRLVYINVLFENLAGEQKASSVAQFFLFDDSGESYSSSFQPITQGDTFPMIDVPVGGTNSGYIAYEVDEDATGLYLEYAVDLSQNQIIRIDLE